MEVVFSFSSRWFRKKHQRWWDAARRVAERAGYGHKWKQRKLILRTGTDQLPPLPGAATFFRRSDDYGSGIGRRLAVCCWSAKGGTAASGDRGWRRRWILLWPGVAHQRCTVHNLRNLLAKAPKTLQAAEKAQEAVCAEWKKRVSGCGGFTGRGCCCPKKEFHDRTEQMWCYSLFHRSRDTAAAPGVRTATTRCVGR